MSLINPLRTTAFWWNQEEVGQFITSLAVSRDVALALGTGKEPGLLFTLAVRIIQVDKWALSGKCCKSKANVGVTDDVKLL